MAADAAKATVAKLKDAGFDMQFFAEQAVSNPDFLMDLGSGDGRTVITAAKRGATALGIEYNPKMVELSRRNAAKQ